MLLITNLSGLASYHLPVNGLVGFFQANIFLSYNGKERHKRWTIQWNGEFVRRIHTWFVAIGVGVFAIAVVIECQLTPVTFPLLRWIFIEITTCHPPWRAHYYSYTLFFALLSKWCVDVRLQTTNKSFYSPSTRWGREHGYTLKLENKFEIDFFKELHTNKSASQEKVILKWHKTFTLL